MDIISPLLYKKPGLDEMGLRKRFKNQLMNAYMAAIMLSDSNQEAFRSIVTEEFLEDFYDRIDKENQTIQGKEEVLARIVGDVVEVMVRDEVRESLEDGMRILSEIPLIKQLSPSTESDSGPIRVSEVVPKNPFEKEAHTQGPFLEEDSQQETDEIAKVYMKETLSNALDMVVEMESKQSEDTEDGEGAAEEGEAAETEEGKSAEANTEAENTGGDGGEDSEEEDRPALYSEIDSYIKLLVESEYKDASQAKKVNVDKKIDEIFAKFEEESSTTLNRVANDLTSFERIMDMIYTRYNKNPQAKKFKNSVEGMTLMNLMLLFKKDLSLGKTFSHLYDMLIDLIILLDADDVASGPRPFLQERSLTRYFDDFIFQHQGRGYKALMTILNQQGDESLKNVVHFVSELRGVKYLFDMVSGDPEAEVIIVNASCE